MFCNFLFGFHFYLNEFNVSHSMLGISKSNFSTTRLELENIILSNIIILYVFHYILGISRFKHGGIRSNHIAKHVYSKVFFIAFLGKALGKNFL